MRKPFVLVVASDTHCGHKMGLTPPKWQSDPVQVELWKWYCLEMRGIGKVDAAVFNGDVEDGPGHKCTIAHITTDMNEQVDMAVQCIKQVKARKVYMTYGTPYHVTGPMEYEKIVADKLGAEIDTSLTLDIRGKVFSFRHHSGKTSIPHGQGTLIGKRLLWEVVHGRRVDYCIRSHVHEYCYLDTPMGCAITTPALQVGDAVYGRKFDSWYDVGFLEFRIHDGGKVDMEKHILRFDKKNTCEVLK